MHRGIVAYMPYACYALPLVGEIAIQCDPQGTAVCGVLFEGEPLPVGDFRARLPVLNEAAAQLRDRLSGGRAPFTVPLMLPADAGGCFRALWQALRRVPYGETVTYAELAVMAGYGAGYARVAGTACRRNPIPLIIPCHRVVASGGTPGGYRGGTALKRALLELENRNNGGALPLFNNKY